MEIRNKIQLLPWHPTRRWSARSLDKIKKIIVHQELGESNVEGVNQYHIGPNHVSPRGCPHFCYHFGIEKDGSIVQANELSSITWHTKGYNTESVGIMLVGNFNGTGYALGKEGPSQQQMDALQWLVDWLQKALNLSNQEVYGHYHFGKPACPGYVVSRWIENYRNDIVNRGEGILKPITDETDLQTRLKKLGYYIGNIDGIVGMQTKQAIFQFQKNNGLTVDGIVGPQTSKKIMELTK